MPTRPPAPTRSPSTSRAPAAALRRLHDRARDDAPVPDEPGHDRRLHADRGLAEHERRGSPQHRAQDRVSAPRSREPTAHSLFGGHDLRGLVINGGFNYTIPSAGRERLRSRLFIGTDATGTTASDEQQRRVSGSSGDFQPDRRRPFARRPEPDRGSRRQHICSTRLQRHDPRKPDRNGRDGSRPARKAAQHCIVDLPGRHGNRAVRGNVIAGGGTRSDQFGNASDSTSQTIIQGNFIGTDVTGTMPRKPAFRNPRSGRRTSSWAGPAPVKATSSRSTGARGSAHFLRPNRPARCPIRQLHLLQPPPFRTGHECLGIDFRRSPDCDPTVNDLGDGDTEPNDGQNFPMITSAATSLVERQDAVTGKVQQRGQARPTARLLLEPGLRRPAAGFPRRRDLSGLRPGHDRTVRQREHQRAPAGHDRHARCHRDGDRSGRQHLRVLATSRARGRRQRPGPGRIAGVTLTGFHFLSGATVTVGGVPRRAPSWRATTSDHHDADSSAGQPQ